MNRKEYNKRRKEAVERHTADKYGYYGEMMDINFDYINSLELENETLKKQIVSIANHICENCQDLINSSQKYLHWYEKEKK